MSLQQCAWGSSDAALEVSPHHCLTFGPLGGMPIPVPSAGKGPGPSQHSLSPDCSPVPSIHPHQKGHFFPSVKAPQSGLGSFLFHVVASRRSPSCLHPWVSGKQSTRTSAVAYTRGQGIGRKQGHSVTAPQEQVGTHSNSLIPAGACGLRSLPPTWRSPRPAGAWTAGGGVGTAPAARGSPRRHRGGTPGIPERVPTQDRKR